MRTYSRARIFHLLTQAAQDRDAIAGWTHSFYRYPARFSPRFAAAAIECYSRPSELVLDPYMGGGTTVVEAIAAGRRVVGNDLNSLAAFITKVKVTVLSDMEMAAFRFWITEQVPQFGYRLPAEEIQPLIQEDKTRNMSLVRARFIKKAVAGALASLAGLPTQNVRDFAKCLLLRVSQWALDGRQRHTSLREFRKKLADVAEEMLGSIRQFNESLKGLESGVTILNMDAQCLGEAPVFQNAREKASLVVTSPPYPGVHVLYHRWQVDGRRETPAPYWIAGCSDGQGASFYNFGDRRNVETGGYFETSLATLHAIRSVIRPGGYMVQMVAFSRPDRQLPRYLANMEAAGFVEVSLGSARIWRQVPHRKWHATLVGRTHSSKEVVLVHRAV